MTCDKPISKSELHINNNNSNTNVNNTIQKLVAESLIRLSSDEKLYVPNFKKAYEILNEYSIRGIRNTVDILFNKKVVGERSLPQAIEELHENAIYFLSGKRYQVKNLHYDAQHTDQPYYAELISIPTDYPYYTRAMIMEMAREMDILASARIANDIIALKPDYKAILRPVENYLLKNGQKILAFIVDVSLPLTIFCED